MSQPPKAYPDDAFSIAALRTAKWIARHRRAERLAPIHLCLGFSVARDEMKVGHVAAFSSFEQDFTELRQLFELPAFPELQGMTDDKMPLSDGLTELLKRGEGKIETILGELNKVGKVYRILTFGEFRAVLERAFGLSASSADNTVGTEALLGGAYASLVAGDLKEMRAATALLSANLAAIEALLGERGWIPSSATREAVNPWRFSEEMISQLLEVPDAKSPFVAALNAGIRLGARILSKERTAYHEAGHAVVSYTMRPELTVVHVTIIEDGSSDGSTSFEPTSPFWDRFRRADLLTGVRVAMAGRLAEEIKFGADEGDTGAQSDIDQATRMAWKAISQSGLDVELGPVNLSVLAELTRNSTGLLFDKAQERLQILLKEAVKDVEDILRSNWPKVEAVAQALIKGREMGDDDLLSVLTAGKIANLPGSTQARSRPASRRITFATLDGILETLEGPVRYQKDDAIVLGEAGESWPVGRKAFEKYYQPQDGVVMGQEGLYLKKVRAVIALPLNAASRLDLSDGRGILVGKRGDWLVDYGDGDLAVVSGPIFESTYELL